jgi:5'-methylthioadenosine phosphorylase
MEKISIGIIGGSGFYKMDDVKFIEEKTVKTPFGKPSDNYIIVEIEGKRVSFLSRHSRGHKFNPSEINYRANIYGFKMLGVERIISVSAVGSLKEEVRPLDIVLVDQFFDRTFKRENTFFENGIVAHVSFAHPTCPILREHLFKAAKELGLSVHNGGTYINIEGPQFSTIAESETYRKFGFDVIGMTNATEAKLAREAELCYTTVALVTDYDCWKEDEEDVSVEMVIENLKKNTENAQKLIKKVIPLIPENRDDSCTCKSALKYSIITSPDAIPETVKDRLRLIIGKYI